MEEKQRPGIGVAVVVYKDDKILMGEDFTKGNICVHGVPGGHWESGESLAEAAKRETYEESGIKIKNLALISIHEFFRPDKNKSYVTVGFKAEYESGVPKDEANLRKNWMWINPESLPKSTFPPDKILIKRAKSNTIWSED